ncbi:MAG TPA: hypothetical protein PLL10_02215, partial [Elusimicrobiales bacterium]|nr:hypothetical protein [Elusimicrobiales bacterium]
GADRYAGIKEINSVKVTGRAYSWMSDEDYYHPGGSFVRIPNSSEGCLGDNRFFTLKERKHETSNYSRHRDAAVPASGKRKRGPSKRDHKH